MIEVELKAHLRDRRAVEARVATFARFAGSVQKFDSYWHGPDWRLQRETKGFRIREEDGSSVVTFKTKRVEAGLEVNLEREFGVSDPQVFVELCQRLGCEPFYTKRKRGSKYVWDAIPADGPSGRGGEAPPFASATIEIIEVEGLGDFIEIEVLLESEEPAAMARAGIRGLLERSGVSASEIEPRYYSELLMAAGRIPRI